MSLFSLHTSFIYRVSPLSFHSSLNEPDGESRGPHGIPEHRKHSEPMSSWGSHWWSGNADRGMCGEPGKNRKVPEQPVVWARCTGLYSGLWALPLHTGIWLGSKLGACFLLDSEPVSTLPGRLCSGNSRDRGTSGEGNCWLVQLRSRLHTICPRITTRHVSRVRNY